VHPKGAIEKRVGAVLRASIRQPAGECGTTRQSRSDGLPSWRNASRPKDIGYVGDRRVGRHREFLFRPGDLGRLASPQTQMKAAEFSA
jgi:hypothetical protein